MPLDPVLLSLLVCPEDQGALLYLESEAALYNPRLKRRYPIVDAMPQLVMAEATSVSEAEHQQLLALAHR